jgi:hypothetical protein
VHDAVAVEGRLEVALRRDAPHRFGAAVIGDDDAAISEPGEGVAQLAGLGQVAADLDLPAGEILEVGVDDAAQPVQGQRPVVDAEQRQGDERSLGDRRGSVDAVAHLEGHLLDP